MKNSKIKNIKNKIIKLIIMFILIVFSLYNFTYTIGKEYDDTFNVKIFGFQLCAVTIKAMEPEISYNDIVIYKETEDKQLNENDIIVLYKNNELVIRRIMSKTQGVYITKGDNYLYNDKEALTSEEIEGKIYKVIPKVGIFLRILQSKILTVILTIILILIFMHNKRKLEKSNYRRRMKQEKKTS